MAATAVSIDAVLEALPLGDVSQPTCNALFPARGAGDVSALEEIAPSPAVFEDASWPSTLDALEEYFEASLAKSDGAERFWNTLRATQSSVDKPHQQLVTALFDRVRQGCYQSGVVCLRWFSLAGGMQGLDAAKGILLGEIFSLLKLARLNTLVDSRGNAISTKLLAGEAVQSFMAAIGTFVARQTELANAPSFLLVNYITQMFLAMDKLGVVFDAGSQVIAQAVLTQLVTMKVNGRQGYLVTPIMEKLVPFVTCLLYTSPSPRDRG